MTIRYIDFEEADRIVKLAVESKPEGFVYRKPYPYATCQYRHVDERGVEECGCLIGTALVLGGYVTVEQLGEMDDLDNSGILDVIDNYLSMGDNPIEFSGRAAVAMEIAQSEQDLGSTWAYAYGQAFGL